MDMVRYRVVLSQAVNVSKYKTFKYKYKMG